MYASALWRGDAERGWELAQLDIQQEASFLAEAVGNAPVRVQLATAVNLSKLLTTVPSDRFVALHMALHCGDNGQELLLEDDAGGVHALSLKDLESVLVATGGAGCLGLVFVNACSSELAGRIFVAAGARHVICCRGAVFDATARCFTRAFYLALHAGGKTISQAFNIAKAAVRTVPQVGLRGEAEKYLLLPEDDPHYITMSDFEGLDSGNSLADTSTVPFSIPFFQSSTSLPGKVEDFCGRARELWMLMTQLSSGRRCINVFGASQIGKTAMLRELARFEGAPGRRFDGRVIYFDAMQLGSDAERDNSLLWDMIQMLATSATQLYTRGSTFDMSSLEDVLSPASDARLLRSRLVHMLQRLEHNGQKVLLIMDNLHDLLSNDNFCEEWKKLATELLLRTERVVFVVALRQSSLHVLGAHKVISFRLEPLRSSDAAKLFLWRVHRPLMVSDLSEAGVEYVRRLPLALNSQSRGQMLLQISNHPLLRLCRGNPGLLRTAAARVLPGAGSMWDIHREVSTLDVFQES